MLDAKEEDRGGGMPFEERTINGYVLREEIGFGGMSRVYRATREGTNESFALKAIRIENMAADFERRLRREPEVQQGIGHENIVELIDWFRVRDEFFLVMEYIEGRSMSELIYRESGPMPFERARGYMRQMLRAVNHLHALGIIHRDIKPSNVLVRHDDVVKLADFGIAKFAWQQGQTKTQKGLGTPEYMSPEQARGTHIDHRSDIYSLGITFFEMLTARKPFARGEETPAAYVEVIQSILSKPLPDPRSFQPGIPAGAVRLLAKATAKDPSERFQSATEFLGALEMVEEADFSPATVALGDLPKSAPGYAPPPQPAEQHPVAQEYRRKLDDDVAQERGSRVGMWIAVVLLLLAVAGYFGYQYYDRNIRLQSAGQLDPAESKQIAAMIAADYRTYSMDHNAGGLASLFAERGNTYFSLKNASRGAIERDAQKFFDNIEVTNVYDVAVDSARALDDSTITTDWLTTYERIKKDGSILRGQTMDRLRIELIDGEWLITRQTSRWVRRKNEPAPELIDEPEVIDVPNEGTPTPDDNSDGGDDNPPLFPPPTQDTSGQQAPPSDPNLRGPTDGRQPDIGTPPINPNGGTQSSTRRFPSGPVDRPPNGQNPSNQGGR
jgi:serine/threonine protein kinase